jgi:hypothetical protein
LLRELENLAAIAAHTSIGSAAPCLGSGRSELFKAMRVGRSVEVIMASGMACRRGNQARRAGSGAAAAKPG